jgi:regulator of replication initiation timing
MEKRILALADKLKLLRDTKSDVEEEVKYLNAEIEKVTGELTELMTENEMPSFTRSGFTYSLSTRTFASALAGDKETLYAALRENGYGGLITETVNSNTLSSTVSELIEQNGGSCPDWLVGKINTYDKVSVRIAKSAKKS